MHYLDGKQISIWSYSSSWYNTPETHGISRVVSVFCMLMR